MSRSKNKNTAGPGERHRETRPNISLATARRMLPLVSQVVADIQSRWNHLADLEAEQADLDQRRRKLDWPERSRRYQIADELTSEQKGLQNAVAELEQLDVVLVDAVLGEVAFPTVLNGRRGYYIWRAGNKDLGWWCYAHDPARHAIPPGWREIAR